MRFFQTVVANIAWALVLVAFLATAAGGLWFYGAELLDATEPELKKWADRGNAVAPFVGVLSLLSVIGALWALHLQRVALAVAREEAAADRLLQLDGSELSASSTMAALYGDALARIDRNASPVEHQRLTELLNKEIEEIRAIQLRIFDRRAVRVRHVREGWLDPKADAQKKWIGESKVNG
jgi:hypothetical protein